MSNTHEEIRAQFEAYIVENVKFEEKGVKVAGTRARKALNELTKLAKLRRKEIQDAKSNG